MSDDTVHMIVSKHSCTTAYHSNSNCHALRSAVSNKQSAAGYADDQNPVRTITKADAESRGLRLCKFCDPNVKIKHGQYDGGPLKALKRAAKSD